MKEIELLAPVGSFDSLKAAVQNGADAVYFGGEAFSLRAAAQNFTFEEIKEGAELAHSLGKKIYCTVNVMPRNEGIEKLPEFLKSLEEAKVDAVLVSDLGVFRTVQKYTNLPIHISTQANTVNYEGCNMWHDLGAERVVLARECSLKEIKEIRQHIPEELELEVFVHGAMCMSYSGKCTISNYTTGRDANKGSCAQSCRWKYTLMEENSGEYTQVVDNIDPDFFFNTKDLCMIEYIPQIFDAGITSLKIEGRMKTAYYVATTVRAYRMALDEYYKDPENWKFNPMWLEELKKGSHRDYSTGFFLNRPDENSNNYKSASYIRNYDFIGLVRGYDSESGLYIVEQRNKMSIGDKIEVIGPYKETMFTTIEEMYDEEGNPIESAPHARQIVKMKVGLELKENYILRKPIEKTRIL